MQRLSLMGLMVWLTKKLYFPDVSNSFLFHRKSCYFCKRNLPSFAHNKAVIVEPWLVTFHCFPFDLDVKLLKCSWNFLSHVLANPVKIILLYLLLLLNLVNNLSLIGSQRNRRNKSKLYLPWLHKYTDCKESTIIWWWIFKQRKRHHFQAWFDQVNSQATTETLKWKPALVAGQCTGTPQLRWHISIKLMSSQVA